MKKIIVLVTIFLLSMNAFSSKIIVVGVLERYNKHEDYYCTIKSMNDAPERVIRLNIENELKQYPGYNAMTDFIHVFIGFPGEKHLTIIEYKNKYGVGIGCNEKEALKKAENIIKLYFGIGSYPKFELNKKLNYKIKYSKNLTDKLK